MLPKINNHAFVSCCIGVLGIAAAAPVRAAAPRDSLCADLAAWRAEQPADAPRWLVQTSGPAAAHSARIADRGNLRFDAALVSPPMAVPRAGLALRWRQHRALSWANSVGVLDIAIDGGDWHDFTAAGGRFLTGGYDSHAFAGNPLGVRPAWGGNTAASETRALIPAAAHARTARLRFRFGSSGTGDTHPGWRIEALSCEAP